VASAPALAVVGGVTAGVGIASGIGTVAGIVAISAGVGAVTAKAAEVISDKLSQKKHTVYTLSDPETGEVRYVGRTTNYEKRMSAHQKEGSRTANLLPSARIDNLNYFQARGVEQLGMLYYNTHISKGGDNKIWGIRYNNPRGTTYSLAGLDIGNYLYNQISNEVLCWTSQ